MHARHETGNLQEVIILHCPLKEDVIQRAQAMKTRGTVKEALALSQPKYPKEICDSWLIDLRYLNFPLRGELAVADRCSDCYGSCILLCSSYELRNCIRLCNEITTGKLREFCTPAVAVKQYERNTFDDFAAGSSTSLSEFSRAACYQTIFQPLLLAACEHHEQHVLPFQNYMRQNGIGKCTQEQKRLAELRQHLFRVDMTLRDIQDVSGGL